MFPGYAALTRATNHLKQSRNETDVIYDLLRVSYLNVATAPCAQGRRESLRYCI